MVTVTDGSKKCGPLRSISCQLKRKRPAMERVKTKQCADVLKKLMTHEAGWVFNQPVDPVALNIPDYFDMISEPMDLGTIKAKLERDLYADAQEFVADVKLTFSNAMRYNPPANPVHVMAKELNDIFSTRWKSLELKWKEETSANLQKPAAEILLKRTKNSKQGCQKQALPKALMTSADKQKLKKDLASFSSKNMPNPLHDFFQRFGSASEIKERVEMDINIFDEKTAWELHRIVKSCMDARLAESTAVKSKEPSIKKLSLKIRTSDGIHHASKDVDHGRLSCKSHANTHLDRLACNSNITSSAERGDTKNESSGAMHTVREKNVCTRYQPATPNETCTEGFCDLGSKDLIYDEQLSPSKALRAAKLKSRFADTILKAQQKTLLSHGEKGDPEKMRLEKEKLERRQQEEKIRIEAQVKAAEAAARMRAEAEMKMQREQQRKAARIALQKMVKTVEIDDNREILKDLEMFVFSGRNDLGVILNDPLSGFGAFQGNPLERLGLFIKNDFIEDEDDLCPEMEEGEIGS